MAFFLEPDYAAVLPRRIYMPQTADGDGGVISECEGRRDSSGPCGTCGSGADFSGHCTGSGELMYGPWMLNLTSQHEENSALKEIFLSELAANPAVAGFL